MLLKNTVVFSFMILLTSGPAMARLHPSGNPEVLDWSAVLKKRGISLSFAQTSTLREFEALGVAEHHLLSVDLIRLAAISPSKTQSWIQGATQILSLSSQTAQSDATFRITRTEFLSSCVNSMVAEGHNTGVFSAQRMTRTFKRYQGSPRAFYKVTQIISIYADLVATGRLAPGERGLEKAGVELKVVAYKEKMELGDLPYLTDSALREKFDRELRHHQHRNVASVRSAMR